MTPCKYVVFERILEQGKRPRVKLIKGDLTILELKRMLKSDAFKENWDFETQFSWNQRQEF